MSHGHFQLNNSRKWHKINFAILPKCWTPNIIPIFPGKLRKLLYFGDRYTVRWNNIRQNMIYLESHLINNKHQSQTIMRQWWCWWAKLVGNDYVQMWWKYVGWHANITLQLRHNERDGVSNHQRLHCLLNCWFRRRSKKTPKLHVTGLCAGNSPVTGEFPTQKASYAENVSTWWRHHDRYEEHVYIKHAHIISAASPLIPWFRQFNAFQNIHKNIHCNLWPKRSKYHIWDSLHDKNRVHICMLVHSI